MRGKTDSESLDRIDEMKILPFCTRPFFTSAIAVLFLTIHVQSSIVFSMKLFYYFSHFYLIEFEKSLFSIMVRCGTLKKLLKGGHGECPVFYHPIITPATGKS